MKLIIGVILLGVIAGLLGYEQYQMRQEQLEQLGRWQAQQEIERIRNQIKKQREHDEFVEMVCGDVNRAIAKAKQDFRESPYPQSHLQRCRNWGVKID